MADQQASLYGCGCWSKGDIKISLGTGTFVDMNTENNPHASMNGLFLGSQENMSFRIVPPGWMES